MPARDEILEGLTRIANEAVGIAIAWHVAVALALGALFVGWRPSLRQAAVLLVLPLLSVAACAWAWANPFNGTAFTLLGAGLAIVALRQPPTTVRRGSRLETLLGAALVAFGWAYPHFLEVNGFATYLYAAPLGVVPCPTLACVIGLTLIAGGLGSRGWRLLLALGGAFYALFGVVRLGVWLDVPLLVGALAMAWKGAALARRYGLSA